MFDTLTLPRPLRASPWPARVVLAGAFVLLAWKVVEAFWLVLAGPDLPVAAALPVQAAPEPSAPTQLAKWHLFGSAQGGVDLAALAQARVQETALNLILRGTFNETRPEGGVAIIADQQGVDRPYRVGDLLPGEARLEAIHAGYVLLSRNGVNETLSLRVVDAAAAPTGGAAPRAASRAPLPGTAASDVASFAVAPVIAPGMPDMQSYRAANLPNVQELAQQVQVFPVFANGRMRGVRLGAGRDSDVLTRAGLLPTDIVTQVNGIPLDGPARQADLLASLRDARQVQVEVERDGKTIRLQLGL